MSKRFRENYLRVLKSIYYMEDPKKITKEIKKKKISGGEMVDVLLFLKKKGLVNFKNLDIPVEINLTDKGLEFVVSELDRKKQNEFNKIIAFTASILALIGIHGFINNLNLINESNLWLNYVFLILVIVAIGPIVAFIINSYFSKGP